MEKLTQIMKALSDSTRIRIMHLLIHQPLCVCEMMAILHESQPKISKHMHTLYHAGLVKRNRSRQFITYQICDDEPLIDGILPLIKQYQAQDEQLQSDYQNWLKPEVWSCQISEPVR